MNTAIVKQAGSNLAKYGSTAAGLVLGSMIMKKIPAFGPPIVQKLLPGTVGMVLAVVLGKKFSNEHVKAAALGLGLAGFVDVLSKLTAGQTGVLATVNSALPTLNGLGRVGYVQNYGDYPPSYFMDTQRAYTNPLNGLSSNAYQLQGPDGGGYQLQGWMQFN